VTKMPSTKTLSHSSTQNLSEVELIKVKASKANAILVKMVNERSYAKRLSLIVDLITRTILGDDSAYGLIRKSRGGRVYSDTSQLTRQQLVVLKTCEEKPLYSVIDLAKLKMQLVLCTNKRIDPSSKKLISDRIEAFDVRAPSRKYRWLLLALLIFISFLPVRENVNSQGRVVGQNGVLVVAEASGLLAELKADGMVAKYNPIGTIKNDESLDLTKAISDLESLNQKIITQGAFATESLNVLYSQKKQLELEIQRMELAHKNTVLRAPIDGIVNWQSNIRGRYVSKGDPLGEIHPAKQPNLEILVDVGDWIDIAEGAPLIFYAGSTKSKHQGTVSSVRIISEIVNGVESRKVYAKLETPLVTGTTGTVSITGSSTVLIHWLLRKPIDTLVATFMAHSLRIK